MSISSTARLGRERGYTMIEVLITMAVLAFGLLGMARLMATMNQTQGEAYQRAQALMLLQEMASRLASAGANASTYVTATPLGTGDTTQPASCAGLSYVDLDKCIWNANLLGAGEKQGAGKVGAMIGARGCVEQVQAADATSGICKPSIYRVSVAWQGLGPTIAPTGIACGTGLYGSDDSLRRVVSTAITVPLMSCS